MFVFQSLKHDFVIAPSGVKLVISICTFGLKKPGNTKLTAYVYQFKIQNVLHVLSKNVLSKNDNIEVNMSKIL